MYNFANLSNNEIQQLFKGKYDKLAEFMLNENVAQEHKDLLQDYVLPFLDNSKIIGEFYSRLKQSPAPDLYHLLMFFSLIADDDYLENFIDYVLAIYTRIKDSDDGNPNRVYLENALLTIMGGLNDCRPGDLVDIEIKEILQNYENVHYIKRTGIYQAVSRSHDRRKGHNLKKLWDKFKETDAEIDREQIGIALVELPREQLDNETIEILKEMRDDEGLKSIDILQDLLKERLKEVKKPPARLREVPLHKSYTTRRNDLLDEFFLPCLRISIKYDRLSGYFTSDLLPHLFRGLHPFIEANGKIRLIVGFMTPSDLEIANKSPEELEGELVSHFFEQLIKSEPLKSQDHLKALAWLIYKKHLSLKLAFVFHNGGIANKEQFMKSGIFHEKIGLFEDEYGDSVSFSGSTNETISGWLFNREEFKVFPSWSETAEYWQADKEKFEAYWSGKEDGLRVIDLPDERLKIPPNLRPKSYEEINWQGIEDYYKEFRKQFGLIPRRKLKKPKPDDDEEELRKQQSKDLMEKTGWIYEEGGLIPFIETEEPHLRKCQVDAIKYLKERNFIGILSMATGSGKSRAAIAAAYELFKLQQKQNHPFLIIVSVPDKFLVTQWSNTVRNYSRRVLEIHSDNKNWPRQIIPLMSSVRKNKNHAFFIGTNLSLDEDAFQTISEYFDLKDILFVGDEMHSLGAPKAQYNLSKFTPKYRIGLSATPIRRDPQETDFLFEWFGVKTDEDMFTFSLPAAQEADYLVRYNYHIYGSTLDQEEFDRFRVLTKRIKQQSYRIKEYEDLKAMDRIERLSQERAKILKKAKSKIAALSLLISRLLEENKFKNIVIYAEDNEQINYIKESIARKVRKDFDIRYSIFDGEASEQERKEIIADSRDGSIHTILAMKCLDQGVDIPSLTRSIFIASAATPLQHIQRAGRVLRKSEGKLTAEIHDFLVVPTPKQQEEDANCVDKIKEIEMTRAKFFNENAENYFQVRKKLDEFYGRF